MPSSKPYISKISDINTLRCWHILVRGVLMTIAHYLTVWAVHGYAISDSRYKVCAVRVLIVCTCHSAYASCV